MPDGDVTPPKQRGLKPAWGPGQSGNPAGRPKGARNKLTEDFLGDVLKAWQERGELAISAMIDDKPGDFVKMVASLVPKEATLNINSADEMTDAELADRIRNLGQVIAPFLASGTGDIDEGIGGASSTIKPAGLH